MQINLDTLIARTKALFHSLTVIIGCGMVIWMAIEQIRGRGATINPYLLAAIAGMAYASR